MPTTHIDRQTRRTTLRGLYLWEGPFYPQFVIPAADVDAAALVDEQHIHDLSRGRVARVGVTAG